MALSEFDIISHYFQQPGLSAEPGRDPGIALGIGDDAALLQLPPEQQLVVSLDVLVETVHFPAGAAPDLIAERALAVNLSDLAAMGADPCCFTLGLTLPQANANWLEAFVSGLRASAQRYRCPLVGGNLTRGPLQLAIQVQGLVPTGQALLRSGARPGDDVYVSGEPGRAALGLALIQQRIAAESTWRDALLAAYYQPQPRLALGRALRGRASAAQDVSDGLLADLEHLARASGVRIVLQADLLPVAPVLAALVPETAHELVLTGGDDYELVFTAPPAQREPLVALAHEQHLALTRIGSVLPGTGVVVEDAAGTALAFARKGYTHFE